MSGTTLCPHCGTRFKIAKEQLEAHHGMVRCGNCQQAFDPRPNFAPEEIDTQLELPILDDFDTQSEHPDLEIPGSAAPGSAAATDQPPVSPAGQDVLIPEAYEVEFLAKPSSRLWAVAAFPLVLLSLAQAVYLFRVELAARMPDLKPGLMRICQILKCSVPLPQKASLMSIESSELKDDAAHRNQIILIALLRNRATYTQAFPDLELTLTDIQDNALARRILKPEDYLPTSQNVSAGFPANQELDIKLRLDSTDLKPVGYRLVLLYPGYKSIWPFITAE
ncbi:MAG: DUF3426 domain-containing protein [Gallionella sp.]